jgi:hypothetical protein
VLSLACLCPVLERATCHHAAPPSIVLLPIRQSPWSQFFKDTELLDVIKLDLSRTYPDSTFFQSEAIQKSMLHILFVWARLHPETSYRQGMNELLAPLLFCISNDSVPASLAAAKYALLPVSSIPDIVNHLPSHRVVCVT